MSRMKEKPVSIKRRLPVGAEVQPEGGVHFRVWAPQYLKVQVVIEGGPGFRVRTQQEVELDAEDDGYYSGLVSDAASNTIYRYRLDGTDKLYPDPASRFQPHGPGGPSEVIDPEKFTWTDKRWSGFCLEGQVIYEMHIGTFTSGGTWESAIPELKNLAAIGITLLEIMPVADFPGKFGWGYDGVNLFAPTQLYGKPDDMRRFIDTAHGLGLGVLLDVVYNHVGSAHNYLAAFSENYFSKTNVTDWGNSINFDAGQVVPVRQFFISNACYWIDEFHLDGLRFDATQNIYDKSSTNILREINQAVRGAAKGRSTILIAESERQNVITITPEAAGGYGLDGAWNDDFHHSAMVALTGHNEGYYSDYLGVPQEFISSLKWGYLYQGQWYTWQQARRGTPSLHLDPSKFILYLQNHDQIANSSAGIRCHYLTTPGRYRAMTALLLLAPGTPMLFQGQEFASSKPFLYFADSSPELSAVVYDGRRKFLAQFKSLADPAMQARIDRPDDPVTFEKCKLDFTERESHRELYQLTRDLIKIRHTDPVFKLNWKMDGAVLSPEAFLLRFFGKEEDRLLLINLGRDLHYCPAPEPLLAPPENTRWENILSTENPLYGGSGIRPLDTEGWFIPGHAAVLLKPVGLSPGETVKQDD